MHLPFSTLAIFCVLALMALLIRRKVPVVGVLAAALVAIAILFRISPVEYLEALSDPHGGFLKRALKLVPLIYLINLLGMLMRETGREKELVNGLEVLVRHRGVMAASTAAAMGLLPMPGGALLSANMVGMTLEHQEEGGHKAAVNLWFRHIWETISPLYPGIILCSELFGLHMGDLAIWNFSLFWAFILFGTLLLLKRVRPIEPSGTYTTRQGLMVSIKVLFPVFLAIGLTIAEQIEGLGRLRYMTGPLPGVGLGVVAAFIIWRPGGRLFLRTLVKALEPKMQGVLILALMIATAVEISGAVQGMHGDLKHYHVPVLLIVAVLPFLTGFLTGLTVGFVGMTVPLAVGLADQWGRGTVFSLAYISGFMGVLYSPVHLCVILSAERFKVDYGAIYRWLIPPGLLIGAALIALTALRIFGL